MGCVALLNPFTYFLAAPVGAAKTEQAVQSVFLQSPPVGLRQRDPPRAFELDTPLATLPH